MSRTKIHPNINCEACKSRGDSMFENLCSHQLSEVSEHKSCTLYKKGQILFHEGTRPLGVFCINQGKVKIYKIGFEGKEQITKIAKEGDILGYKAMIAEESYTVSAETLEDCTICFLSRTNFLELLKESTEFNNALLKEVCHELGTMTESITDQAQRTVRERLAITLLKLQKTYETAPQDTTPVVINLTRDNLANMVGTATETLIRLLHEFKDDELIATQGRKIIIKNPEGLFRTANLF